MAETALHVVQVLAILIGAPLVRGIVARLKAILQRRRGAPLLREYANLGKLFRKEDLLPFSEIGRAHV